MDLDNFQCFPSNPLIPSIELDTRHLARDDNLTTNQHMGAFARIAIENHTDRAEHDKHLNAVRDDLVHMKI